MSPDQLSAHQRSNRNESYFDSGVNSSGWTGRTARSISTSITHFDYVLSDRRSAGVKYTLLDNRP